jgi:pimeloyl-ACP methyl ester carboxylesterase
MKLLLRVAAWFAVLPYVIVAWLVVSGVASWSGILYVIAGGALIGGLATLEKKRPRGISRGAAGAFVAIAVVRMCTASHGRTLELTDSRLVDRVVEESDIALTGTRVLVASGMLHDDARELPGAMRAAYTRFRADQGDAPSPVVATYLGLERSSAFDLILLDQPGARSAVVFLHGFGGSFDLPCWQLARAVEPLGVATACPATGWQGDWSSPEGEATLRRTIDILHARGIERIVLAGLSNGGLGASRLAPHLSKHLSGLILISGADPDAPSPGVPTLVIHGRHDTMTSADESRVYASRTGGRYVELDAGHFAMLVRAEQTDAAIRDFVSGRLPTASR